MGLHKESEPARISAHRADRLAWVAMVLLTLTVFALYVTDLGRQSLWCDEGISVAFASRPLLQVLHTMVNEDLHPPLYYLILHFWMILAGKSEWAVRMPSAFAAVLLVPLAFAIVREVCGQGKATTRSWAGAGVAAASLVGTSPFIAYYAQETRMYSLAAALALAATWTFLRATRTEAQQGGLRTVRPWWLAFSGLLAASLYTQYYSAFIIPAFVGYVLLFDRKLVLRTVLQLALAGLLYLPWVYPAYLQVTRLQRSPDYWVTTHINLGIFLRTMLDTILPSVGAHWKLFAGALGILLLVSLALRKEFTISERRRRFALVFLSFLSPLALTYVMVSLVPKFATRYAIVTAAPLYICIVLVLWALLSIKPLTRVTFGLLIIVAVIVSLQRALPVVQGRVDVRDDTRAVATYLTENVQDGDALLLVENVPHALQYYYAQTIPWYGFHVGQDFSGAADLLTQILRTRTRRIWLLHWHHEFADPTDMVLTELMRVGRLAGDTQFIGYRLYAFDLEDYGRTITAFPQPENATQVDFATGPRLLGFDSLDRDGGKLHYVFYWQALQPLHHNFSMTLSFQDTDGNEYLRQDRALSTDYFLPPVWPLKTPIRGRADVSLPADLPPFTYRVYLSVFDPESRRNLDIVDARGAPQGQSLLLTEFVLTKAEVGAAPSEVTHPLSADMGDGLQLLGFDLPSDEYRQGDGAQLTLWWQSLSKPVTDHQARVRLLNHERAMAWEHQQPLLPGHPTTSWQPGETNRAIYTFVIPADLPAGEYSLQAGSENRVISVAQVRITSRDHHYDVPAMQHTLGARFGQGITLLGYDLQPSAPRPGQALTVTLYWQPGQAITDSFKVSVQLLADDLHVVAQEDSVPVGWTYPTTAWLPGEVIADQHVVALKPKLMTGEYRLIVVLYEEQGKTRLPVEQAGTSSDHVLLTPLRVAP